MNRRFAISVLLATLTLQSATAQINESKTYRCLAKDAVSLEGNGTLGKSAGAEEYRKRVDGMIIDTRVLAKSA